MKVGFISMLALLLPVLVFADTFYLTGSDSANRSSFTGNGAGWKSASSVVHSVPQEGHDYVIDGQMLNPVKSNLEPRSNPSGRTDFAGHALYIRDRDIALLSSGGGPFVCSNLIADAENGAVMCASANQRMEGRVTVPAGGTIAFWMVANGLTVASDIHGEGQVNLRGQTVNAHYTLSFAGDNSNFTGRFAVTGASGQRLIFSSGTSWFGNPAVFDDASVSLTNEVTVYFNESLTASTPNRGIRLAEDDGLNKTYFAVAAGKTVSLDSPIRSSLGLGKSQSGTLILSGPSPELAGVISVDEGSLGFGCSNAFGSASLAMANGTVLRYCSTNGPLVLASAPTGTYTLSIPDDMLQTTDLMSLPESAPFDFEKISLAGGDGQGTLSERVENGRRIVSVKIVYIPEEVRHTFYLRGNDASGQSSFTGNGAGWTNALEQVHSTPQAGNVYVIDGCEPRTKESGHTVFAGDELRLAGGDIALKSVPADAQHFAYGHFICSNLVVTGSGSILNGCPLVETVEGRITIENGAALSFYNVSGDGRSIVVASDLRGAGEISVRNTHQDSYVAFAGDNSGFKGSVSSSGSAGRHVVRFLTPESWFGNPSEFDAASVRWERGERVYFHCSLSTATPNRGLCLTPSGKYAAVDLAVTNGATVSLDMPIASENGFRKSWPGTLVLGADSPNLQGGVTVGEGALGVGSTNALGSASLAMGEGTTLLFASTNGPLALASAPTGAYSIGLADPQFPAHGNTLQRDVLRLPPGAQFDVAQVSVLPLDSSRRAVVSKVKTIRSESSLLVRVVYLRAGTTVIVK